MGIARSVAANWEFINSQLGMPCRRIGNAWAHDGHSQLLGSFLAIYQRDMKGVLACGVRIANHAGNGSANSARQ
jgi:hypothetical protein